MSATCYIVGAGEFYGELNLSDGDIVIAADGGYDTLRELGVTPDLLVGDMDSVKAVPTDIEKLRVPVEKDETDTYLCYLEGVRRGYSNFVILGGVGGREDHTFANFSLLILGFCQVYRYICTRNLMRICRHADTRYTSVHAFLHALYRISHHRAQSQAE